VQAVVNLKRLGYDYPQLFSRARAQDAQQVMHLRWYADAFLVSNHRDFGLRGVFVHAIIL